MSVARFDHIAYGVESPASTFPTLRSRLGLEWVQWDSNVGFAALQAEFPSGFKIEVIHPYEEHLNPFMRRFLDRSGNAPHHLTFRLEGIETYMDRLRGIGIEPVAVRVDTPAWREAFVHTCGGIGILLQLAESDNDKHTASPPEWEALDAGQPARFVRLEHHVEHVGRALEILSVLDGSPLAPASDEIGEYVDVAWQDNRILRLREQGEYADGRHRCLVVDHLDGMTELDSGSILVDPSLGARIVADAAPAPSFSERR